MTRSRGLSWLMWAAASACLLLSIFVVQDTGAKIALAGVWAVLQAAAFINEEPCRRRRG